MNNDSKKKHEDKKVQDEVVEKEHEEEIEAEDDSDDEIEELELKIQHLNDQLKRAVADYINLQRRVEEERREVIKYANRELLLSLLPAFNTLFLAAKFTQDQGIQLTIKSVLESLKNVGVEKIKTEGEKFNAEVMEVVEVVDGDDGKVVEEVRPGFTLYGKLLNPAVVKVGKK